VTAMDHALRRPPSLSRGMLLGAAAVVSGTLLLAGLGHDAPVNPADTGAQPLAQRDLRFADRADGAIVVTDARGGAVVETLLPGQEGFVRGAMRGLVRDRLSAWPDGRLTLHDTATGHTMELHAFGRTNAEAFLRLLKTEEQ
jgi:putative photosynthetic complex assembly protein